MATLTPRRPKKREALNAKLEEIGKPKLKDVDAD
jgi:hypothetical protein